MKKQLVTVASTLGVSIAAIGAPVNGTSIDIENGAVNTNIIRSDSGSGLISNISQYAAQNSIVSSSQSGSTWTNNTFITTEAGKAQIGSSGEVELYSGPLVNPSASGNITGTSIMHLTPTQATMVSTGVGSTTAIGWGPSGGSWSAYTNHFSASASGTYIASATDLSLNATTTNIASTTNNITGITNLNTTGNAATNIGGTGTGAVTLQSGTNSFVLNNSGATLTSDTTIVGATNINATGTAVTNIGTGGGSVNIGSASPTSTNTILGSTYVTGTTYINGTGTSTTTIGSTNAGAGSVNLRSGSNAITVSTTGNTIQGTTEINSSGNANTTIGNSGTGVATIQSGNNSLVLNNSSASINGNVVNIGSNSSSTVYFGSSTGNSTVSANGNRIQNVANAVSGTDAVNLNQLNTAVNNINNAINGLQNQMNSAKAGIAGVTAATNIPGLNSGQKYNLGMAWGNYMAYNGLAIGGNARLAENLTLKVSGSATSGVYSGGAGFALGF